MNPHESLIEKYRISTANLQNEINFLKKKSDRYSYIRLSVFVTGLILSIVNFYVFDPLIALYTFLFFIIILSVVVNFHNKLLFEMKKLSRIVQINNEQTARINLDWNNIPEPALQMEPDDLTIQKDLDLTGKHSLHHLIDISFSLGGSNSLGNNLSITDPDIFEIKKRKQIISELSMNQNFIEGFILKCKMISSKPLDTDRTLSWFMKAGNINFSRKDGFPKTSAIIIASALILTYIILFILNITVFPNSIWIIPLMLYIIYFLSYQNKFKEVIEEAENLESETGKIEKIFLYIEKETPEEAVYFRNEFFKFFSLHSPSLKIKKLQRYILMFTYTSNPILKLILNIIFPYEFVVMKKLTEMRNSIKNNIKIWMDDLHEIECFLSLSNFAYLNPDYKYPEFFDEITLKADKIFNVREMGHPLLSYNKRITNDFALKKENEIVIITGSNMSGKSTFLKTIGINLALAYSGAPVCAKIFNTFLYRLFSCIKVNDSVTDGISYFYAEVKRLKQLLDIIEEEHSKKILFLIDEIFKGTNNKERLEGSRAFIKKLSELNVSGFISTHDLDLVNLQKEILSISNYHFREEIEENRMIFDYKIHEGPCPTTNALRIMELEGLPIEKKPLA